MSYYKNRNKIDVGSGSGVRVSDHIKDDVLNCYLNNCHYTKFNGALLNVYIGLDTRVEVFISDKRLNKEEVKNFNIDDCWEALLTHIDKTILISLIKDASSRFYEKGKNDLRSEIHSLLHI